MKSFFLFTMVMTAVLRITGLIYSETYYLDRFLGDDNFSGTSKQQPWKSLDIVNLKNFLPGDSVLFKCSQSWRGGLDISASGNSSRNIIFTSYGSGIKPEIKGTIEIKGWSVHSGNIYVADVPVHINQLFLDEMRQTIARHPNKGHFTIESVVNSTTFIDKKIGRSTDWTGAMAHVRCRRWTLSSKLVVAFSQGTFSLSEKTHYELSPGWGYYLNNKLDALDAPGEWYYDSTSRRVYFWTPGSDSPDNYLIEGATHSTGVALRNVKYVTVSGLILKHHSGYGIKATRCSNTRIVNNTVLYPNSVGIAVEGQFNTTHDANNAVYGNMVRGANHYGVIFSTNNSEFSGNTVVRTGNLDLLGASGMGDQCCSGRGVDVNGDGNRLYGNLIDSSGYIGLAFNGQNTVIERNLIDHSCMTTDDCAGIYSWNNDYKNPGSQGSVIRNNIVLNSMTAVWGTDNHKYTPGEGIYIDDRIHDVTIEDNTVAHCTHYGIFLHNTQRVLVRRNTIYANHHSQIHLAEDSRSGHDSMHSNHIVGNVCFSLGEKQHSLRLTSSVSTARLGNYDSNYYCNPYSPLLVNDSGKFFTLRSWRAFSGHDMNTKTSPVKLLPFEFTDTLSTNMVSNGTFDKNLQNWKQWPSTAKISWETGRGLDGGCLRYLYSDDPENTPLISSSRFKVFKGRRYLIEFSVISNSPGNIGAIVRMSGVPYSSLGFHRLLPMETVRQDYVFMFTANRNHTPARVDIYNSVKDSLFWLDNVSLYEVSATNIDPATQSALFYNMGGSDSVIDLGSGRYLDMDGNTVTGSISLAPFTSRVLIVDSSGNNGTKNIFYRLYRELSLDVVSNPLDGRVRVVLVLPVSGKVRLDVLDLEGLVVQTLLSGRKSAGHYPLYWHASDRQIASGVYLVRFRIADFVKNQKVVFIR